MGSSLRLVVMAGMFLLALLAGWFILTTPGLKPVVISVYAPPRVVAEQRVEDVGQVETDSEAKQEFLLYNKGGEHLRITDVQTSCGCTVADISKRVVAPGDFTRLAVTLDTSIKLGKVRKKITVLSNDPERPALDLFLIGEVLPRPMEAHEQISLAPKDPLVLFKGECATCHVQRGIGKSGKALFQADCAMCHGVNAQGTPTAGPSLLGGDYQDPDYVAHVRRVIAEGSARTPQMPPFSQAQGGPLNADEIDSLVQFLKYQNLQNQMGLLQQENPELEDEAAFQEALKQPH